MRKSFGHSFIFIKLRGRAFLKSPKLEAHKQLGIGLGFWQNLCKPRYLTWSFRFWVFVAAKRGEESSNASQKWCTFPFTATVSYTCFTMILKYFLNQVISLSLVFCFQFYAFDLAYVEIMFVSFFGALLRLWFMFIVGIIFCIVSC